MEKPQDILSAVSNLVPQMTSPAATWQDLMIKTFKSTLVGIYM